MRVSAVRHLAAARGADNGGSARVLRDLSITQCDAGQSAVVPGRDTRDRRTSPLQPRPQRACRQPAYRDHRRSASGPHRDRQEHHGAPKVWQRHSRPQAPSSRQKRTALGRPRARPVQVAGVLRPQTGVSSAWGP